jgi:hypothetical protein
MWAIAITFRPLSVRQHLTFYSSPQNPLGQLQPNFGGIVLVWPPSKLCPVIELRAGLLDTNLKGTHSGTIPARFGLIWFSGFRWEDLNVIFYQNMPNLHNRYRSAERKITQKNAEYMLNYDKRSHLNLLIWNRWTKLNQTWQGWSLGGSLSKLCPTAPPSIQDGCCY